MDQVWEEMKMENGVRPVEFRVKLPKEHKKKPKKTIMNRVGKEDTQRMGEVCSTFNHGDLDEIGDDTTLLMLSPEEILTKYQRDINCLSDEQLGVRKRAMETIANVIFMIPSEYLPKVFPTFAKPLFKRFNDPVEKVRTLSLRVTTQFIQYHDNLLAILPYLMPAVVNRVGSSWTFDEKLHNFISNEELRSAHERGRIFLAEKDANVYKKPREPSEEVRLLLYKLLHTLLENLFSRNAASLLNAYIYDIICILVYGVHDPFPDAKIQSCQTLVLLGHNMVSVMKHFAIALVRTSKHLLQHRLSKVRIAAILCIRDLVQVPNVEKCKGAGTEAIADLVAHQDENIIPVAAFYTHEIKVNLFAMLDQDNNVSVRKAFYETITAWLIELPDRYDHESRLMPYLLSAVADECPDISFRAMQTIDILGARHAKEHPDDVIERTQYAVDGNTFCNFDSTYPPPFTCRPRLGTRLYIRGRCRRFINTLLRELSHWQGPTRVHAARLLLCLLIYCEDTITVDLHHLVNHLIANWNDQEISSTLQNIGECCGRFTQPSTYIPLLLPYLQGETTSFRPVEALELLTFILNGASTLANRQVLCQLPELTATLTMPFLLDSNNPKLQNSLKNLGEKLVEILDGPWNSRTESSFEIQGRLFSKSIIYERLLHILTVLSASEKALITLRVIAGSC
ncbi:hypothetical protein THRCLA_06647 [Thraustotheca clavata]|uniref:Uncharacterized protein n=1 Tax=Thraustotheca clavata TaxID=74557 RepID=A0A1V9ZM72_9STRA|nr:hypothetical protein THRCLA_06647 [Thraustotheca clavata]